MAGRAEIPRMKKDIGLMLLMVIALVVMAGLLARFTVLPMMENYNQCGSIFLCKGEPHEPIG